MNDYVYLKPLQDIQRNIGTISNALTHQYKLIQMGFAEAPIRLGIVYQKDQAGKFKKDDAETNLERLKIVCDEFIRIVDIEFEFIPVDEIPFETHEYHTSVWQFKTEWNPTGKMIGIKDTTYHSKRVNEPFENNQYRGLDVSQVELYAKIYGYDVYKFDYSTPFREIINNVSKCEFVVADLSGLAAMCVWIGTPLKIVTEKKLNCASMGSMRTMTYGNGNLTAWPFIDFPTQGYGVQGWEKRVESLTPEDLQNLKDV